MNNDYNQPAFPAMDMNQNMGIDRLELRYKGMTKRELIAAMAMQGMLANGNLETWMDLNEIPKESLKRADELLKQLEK